MASTDQDPPVASSLQSATVGLALHAYVDGGMWQGSTKQVWFARGWYLLTFDPKSNGRQPLAIVQSGSNPLAMLAYTDSDPIQEYWEIFEVRRAANLKVSAVAARARVYAIEVRWSPSGGHPTGS